MNRSVRSMCCPELYSIFPILGCTGYKILADMCRIESVFAGMRRVELSYGLSVNFRVSLCIVSSKIFVEPLSRATRLRDPTLSACTC